MLTDRSLGRFFFLSPFRRLLKFAQPVYDLRLFQGADPL